jgi:hypothetical protein
MAQGSLFVDGGRAGDEGRVVDGGRGCWAEELLIKEGSLFCW